MAVILLDMEGEYCAINEPTDDPRMIQALADRGLQPEGVANTSVFHLVGREPYNPDHPRIVEFSLRFSDLSPFALAEILELNEAQEERFLKGYDITKTALERFNIWPRNADERAQLLELDELSTGYPGMVLNHVYDVVRLIATMQAGEPDPPFDTPVFARRLDELKAIINGAGLPKSVPSWRKVQGRLGTLKRLTVFDSTIAEPLDYEAMLQAGQVSIIDLSDTDSTYVNNLVIAELLRGVQEQQDQNYKAAVEAGRQPTPTLVLIEEAHEFLSAQRIAKMQVLFQQVQRIARRGRKRWLGLGFITQLPQHLPDEVLGLINNWILHKIGDASVITRLKRSIGGISEGFWETMPSLAPGQAVVSFTTLTRPLRVGVDPTPCKLLMVE